MLLLLALDTVFKLLVQGVAADARDFGIAIQLLQALLLATVDQVITSN
jgi:GTP cyclohydrolase II